MRVLLVHGLGRTPMSMVLLARRLSKSGHEPEHFWYIPAIERHDQICANLIHRLRALAAMGEEVGLIGHSFGGLLLRDAVAQVPELRVRHFVMLGTPNQPPRLAAWAIKSPVWRILNGSCGRRLAAPEWFARLPVVCSPHTVIAGTVGWPASFGPFHGEPNDGIVSVGETQIDDDATPVLIPVIHATLITNRHVFEVIAKRLSA